MIKIEDLQPLADLFGQESKARLIGQGMKWEIHAPNYTVSVKMGKKFGRVDIGGSGRFMVDLETGEIFGIKGYGVVHRGRAYGTLATIADWYWGDDPPVRKANAGAV